MAYGVSNGHVNDDVKRSPKVLWGSTVGYPSDSLASCYVYWTVETDELIHISVIIRVWDRRYQKKNIKIA